MRWFIAGLALSACTSELSTEEPDPAIEADRGVDVAKKVIRIGMLNDETGPGAAIGGPFAAGKRMLAEVINAGGTELLPEGWTVTLVEHDHASDPAKVTQAFDALRDDVLFIGTSFGTKNTIDLRQQLNAHTLVAFPASLSSEMAKHPFTPPLGASYRAEARRALDFMVDQAGTGEGLRAAIVFQDDPYGTDAVAGFVEAAKQYGLGSVERVAVPVGAIDAAAVVASLRRARASHVMLAVLPSATAALLTTAEQEKYAPTWVGATPAWSDTFFDGAPPASSFATYHQANSLPWWGEDVPGMGDFEAAYAAHGAGAPKGLYTLLSYAQGLASIAAAKRAIEADDVTRQGFYRALTSLRSFDAGGLVRPIDLSSRPYALTEEVRILTPDVEARGWNIVLDYGRPGVPARMRPGQEALDAANAAHPPGEGL